MAMLIHVAAPTTIAYLPHMLLRLILALLVATLAFPAAAMSACHQPAQGHPPAAMAHSGHPAPTNAPHAPKQFAAQCIGCIAPATALTPRLAKPTPGAAIAPAPAPATGAPRGRSPPETPPPRIA